MNTDTNAAQAARYAQQMLMTGWQQAMASLPAAPSASEPLASGMPQLRFDPERLQAIQADYTQGLAALWCNSQPCAPHDPTALPDKRFAAPAWNANPLAHFAAQSYLLHAHTLTAMGEALQSDEKTLARVRFALEQYLAANAPSNFMALNADALQLAVQTQGQSIAQGMQNMFHDLQQGHVSMTDESLFEVGRNVATTEGAVVFENDFFQLIEYTPLTAQVYERPFLLVPPCINKFYILDLQPENSLIRYAVGQGHRTFVVSWRNPDASMAQATWDDYIEHAAIKAMQVVQAITGAKTLNALGFCVGGTILSTAIAVLAGRGQQPVASVTLLTSLLDFTDVGILDVFIDEKSVAYREQEMGQGGLLKGKDLASTFSFLRPNDLVWNYVVGNYLKGETPPAFDLLYWNSDSTNLPGPFYAWYLRYTYLENRLCQPGSLTVCGQPVDLSKISIPAYIYGSKEDHIVPIGGAYASTQHLSGPKRFVMGASGHIAGVINPPSKNKRSYWTNDPAKGIFPPNHAAWLVDATEHPGSWWGDWAAWLQGHAGKRRAAPKGYGSAVYPATEPAPGRYVKVRA